MTPAPITLALLLAWPLSRQEVRVVDDDGGPGVDHTSIQAAIDAAADGSIVLVRPGSYTELLLVDSKSLVLQAEPGVALGPSSSVLVRNLAADGSVTLRGLHIDAFGNNTNELLVLEDIAGSVWVEDCELLGSNIAHFTSPATVIVDHCADVVLRDVVVRGGTDTLSSAGPGIRCDASTLHLYEVDVDGGTGTTGGTVQDGGTGGTAVHVTDGLLFASHSILRGGTGGTTVGIFGCPDAAGDGGIGLVLDGSAPQAFLRNSVLLPGAGGVPAPGCDATPGVPGAPSEILAGTLVETTRPAHTSSVTSPVRTDETAQIQLVGAPGDFAFLLYTREPGSIFLPGLVDALLVGTSPGALFVGVLGASGTAGLGLSPTLPPGIEGRVLFTQAFYYDAVNASGLLGAPSAVLVLDAAL